jgi:hypothetical protein
MPGLDDHTRARQFVRAAGMAQAAGDHDHFQALLERAREFSEHHPAIAIAEARAIRDGDEMLAHIKDVEPETETERALLHITRAHAQLARGEHDHARAELDLARAAKSDHLAVREFEAILPLIEAQRAIGKGERPDPDRLRAAAERLQQLRQGLDEKARWPESARIAARAAEAYALADEQAKAREVLQSIQRLAGLGDDVMTEVARSAMVSDQPDFVADILNGPQPTGTLRLIQADAQAMSTDATIRAAGAATLTELLDDADDELRHSAAFALLAAAAENRDIAWSDRAAESLRADHPAVLATMHAMHLRLAGDPEGAERVLLPHADDSRALRMLRDQAAQREDWATAKDRSRAIISDRPSPRDRIIHAEILRHTGDRVEATARFFELALDPAATDDVRDGAHQSLVSIALDDRDYDQALERARAWWSALPASDNAIWTLLFALVRRHEYPEAYELLREYGPQPRLLQQAQIIAEILHRAAPREDAIRAIDALSASFDRREEALEGMLLATVLDAEQEGVQLPDDLQNAAREAFGHFPSRFPESQVMRTFHAPTTAEELDEFLRKTHGESVTNQRQALDQVRDGTTAVSVFAATAPGGDVVGAWHSLNHMPLSFADYALDEHERTQARQAIGAAAVWDGASLFVARSLPGTLADDILHAVPGSMIANTTFDDIDAAFTHLPAAGSTRTTMGYDPETGRGVIEEFSTEVVALHREAVICARELATRLSARPGVGTDADPRLAEIVNDDRGQLPFRALAETMLLAQREARPIYSDDRWIRRGAHAIGIPAFGTLALLDAMTELGFLTEDQRRQARLDLSARGAWGVCLSSEELTAAAAAASWTETPAVIGAFYDRAAWRARPASTTDALLSVLQGAYHNNPGCLSDWLELLVGAGHQALPELHVSLISQVAVLMSFGLQHGNERPLTDAFVRALVRAIRALPITHSTLGYDPILGAVDALLMLFANETDHTRFLIFREATRRLPPLEQFRAIQIFLKIT